MKINSSVLFCLIALLALAGFAAHAQTFSVIHHFTGGADGDSPAPESPYKGTLFMAPHSREGGVMRVLSTRSRKTQTTGLPFRSSTSRPMDRAASRPGAGSHSGRMGASMAPPIKGAAAVTELFSASPRRPRFAKR